MKRNMDLVREILSEVRDTDPFSTEPADFHAGQLPGQWGMKKVSYHLVLLLEEGFLTRSTLHVGRWQDQSKQDEEAGLRLTWKGHDLLRKLNEEKAYL